ncbi:MAG: TetR/AcrR family transcriptional regulator [Dysgonomonas sp.]
MQEKDISTEQVILEAAEKEFLEKGFSGAKTIAIANRAGVNHAMLHYYFRTKENLFNTIFQKKIQTLADSFSASFDPNKSFFDQLRVAIEAHFDFVGANPKLLFFIYGEIIANDERKKELIKKIYPNVEGVLNMLKRGLKSEVARGTIRPIHPVELLMNVVSLNIVTFLAMPLFETLGEEFILTNDILKQRKESNVQFIINALKV